LSASRSALEEAQANLDAQRMPVLPMRFSRADEVRSGRVQDLADVSRMLGHASPGDLARVRAVFEEWLPADRDDLESLITLGQLELKTG